MLFFNAIIFFGFSSTSICVISIGIIDIFLILALIYMLFENNSNKKAMKRFK
ncbi:MAG: hypothetical protein JSV56_03695 [Methanomassiliicoccales archaeon]|nr:MAG: hypothetical protein JSV56_03695 [Methanomassiliicoccales archaeon]